MENSQKQSLSEAMPNARFFICLFFHGESDYPEQDLAAVIKEGGEPTDKEVKISFDYNNDTDIDNVKILHCLEFENRYDFTVSCDRMGVFVKKD